MEKLTKALLIIIVVLVVALGACVFKAAHEFDLQSQTKQYR